MNSSFINFKLSSQHVQNKCYENRRSTFHRCNSQQYKFREDAREAFKAAQHVSPRNRQDGGETRPRTDLRTRCRGRCRGVSRDSVYIVLRDRETPDRQSARSDLWGVSRGREDEKIPLSPRAFFVIHAFVALFRDFGGTTQIRRTLFREGQAIEINILPRFILSCCPRCYSLLFVANSEYIRCG